MTVLLFLILFLTYINQIFPLPCFFGSGYKKFIPDLGSGYGSEYGYRADSELLDEKNSTDETGFTGKWPNSSLIKS